MPSQGRAWLCCVCICCSALYAGAAADTSTAASSAQVLGFVQHIKAQYGLQHVFAWHATMGYWSGVSPAAASVDAAAAGAGAAQAGTSAAGGSLALLKECGPSRWYLQLTALCRRQHAEGEFWWCLRLLQVPLLLMPALRLLRLLQPKWCGPGLAR